MGRLGHYESDDESIDFIDGSPTEQEIPHSVLLPWAGNFIVIEF